MLDSVQKRNFLVILLLILSMAHVYGDDNCSSTCEIEEPCCSCQPVSCGKGFLSADLLYWRASEGGLSSVCDSTETIDITENGVLISRLKAEGHDPDFKWDLGFKIGAGYEFADSHCDIGVYWTHYNSHTGGENHRNEHHWKIDFNVVDVLYGCEWDCSTCFALTPFGGLRFAQIKQKLHTHFISTVNGSPATFHGDSRENFWGLGPLFGVEGEWEVGSGFSLYGNISGAILFGEFDVKSNQIDEFTTGININDLRKSPEAYQPVLDAGFGLRWKTCFCNERLLMLQLGFEHHSYFNHNQFCNYEDLNLGGVSLAIGLQY